MPELPEIECLARELQGQIGGALISRARVYQSIILKSPPGVFEAELPGRRVESVTRRGKFLCLDLTGGLRLWLHFGMTGQLFWSEAPALADPHLHFSLEFEARSGCLLFRDPRRFGKAVLAGAEGGRLPPSVGRLGPEPDFLSAEAFAMLFRSRRARIKSALLDQRLMAGLGNIYADESLHRAGIDPRRRPHRLRRERLTRLHGAIVETLAEAVARGGSSIDDYQHTDGSRGRFQESHRVYGRAGSSCLSCGTAIRRIKLAGRSSFYCPACQR